MHSRISGRIPVPGRALPATFALSLLAAWTLHDSQGAGAKESKPAPVKAPTTASEAKTTFEPYTETVPESGATFEMIPIAGGTFQMGSTAKEKGRGKDEGPVHEVTVRPFWMSKHEVTWAEYSHFVDLGIESLLGKGRAEKGPDAITYPTPAYADEKFGYGGGKQPVIAITIHGVMEYTRWLSKVTGKSYRLPTEAEWEYACRAGTQTPYSFGSSPRTVSEYAWFGKNAKKRPNPVGMKKPNPFGLYDMHGNVAEWVLDRYSADFYGQAPTGVIPFNLPDDHRYPHVARGGGWKDRPEALRCAARRASEKMWSKQDPQVPQSIWWHTEATDVGFRLVRSPDEYPQLTGLRSRITEDSP